MTVTVEILKEEALALLRSLEQLKVLQFVPTKNKPSQKGNVAVQKSNQSSEKPPHEANDNDVIKPLRKSISLEELLKEQKFQGFDRAEMDKLIKEINVEEPIEELLAMLKP